MKKRWLSKLLIALLSVSVFISCEVGLGSAVDTQTPTITISYPPAASVIKEDFILSGTCNDDQAVKSVRINIKQSVNGELKDIDTIEGTVDANKGTWQATINEKGGIYNGWSLADGKYVFDVISIDTSKKESGTASISLEIDNTAPIFMATSPTSEDLDSPTEFGTNFSIKGKVAEDHTISEMVINIYGNEQNFDNPGTPLLSVTKYNIESKDIEELIADKNKDNSKEAEYYGTLYDGVSAGEDRLLWTTISMVDEAKVYRNPEETQNNTTGNKTNFFYILDNVPEWNGVDLSTIQKVVNGTSGSDRSIGGINKDSLLNSYKNNSSKKVIFSINSEASPKYEFQGFYPTDINDIDTYSRITDGQVVNIRLMAGLNGNKVKPDTLVAYRFGPYDSRLSADEINKIYSADTSEFQSFYDSQFALGSAKKLTITLPTTDPQSSLIIPIQEENDLIIADKFYYFSAFAKDVKDVQVIPNQKVFVAKGNSSQRAPEVYWENIASGYNENDVLEDGQVFSNLLKAANSSVITLSGYVVFPDGIHTYGPNAEDKVFSVLRKAGNTTEYLNSDNTWTGDSQTLINLADYDVSEKDDPSIDVDDKKVYWKISIPGATEPAKEYQYEIALKISNNSKGFAIKNIKFLVDTKEPVIEVKSFVPVVSLNSENNLNGKVTFNGAVTETNLESVKYQILNASGTVVYTSDDLGEAYAFEETIDTTDTATYNTTDKQKFDIKIIATDKAGNTADKKISESYSNKLFIVDQSSDKPRISFTKFAAPVKYNDYNDLPKDYYFDTISNKLEGRAIDDDGFASIEIIRSAKNAALTTDGLGNYTGTGTGEELKTVLDSSENVPFTYQMPSEDGLYQVVIIAKDSTYTDETKANRQTIYGPYLFGVDTANPALTLDQSKEKNYVNDAFTVSGTASDENKIKNVTIEVFEGSSIAENAVPKKTWTVTPDPQNKYTQSIPKGTLTDGTYTIRVTAQDYAQKTKEISQVWVVDTVAPTFNSVEIKTDKTTISSKDWYKTANIEVEAVTKVDTAGISAVLYSLDNSKWNSFTLNTTNADGSQKWTATVKCDKQGENKIYIKARDTALNEGKITNDFKTVYIDTHDPNKCDLVSVDGETLSGVKMVNTSKADFAGTKFVVSVADFTQTTGDASGIKEVKLVKVGQDLDSNSYVAGTDKGSGNWEFTINKEIISTGEVCVQVTDNAGNTTGNISLFNIENDNTPPVINIRSITPVVISENENRLNGNIVIDGSVKEDNLVSVKYEILNASGSVVYTSDDLGDAYSFTETIDTTNTTKYKTTNNDKFDIQIIASDKAGNTTKKKISESYANKLFLVDQSSDKPNVNPSNFTFKDGNTVTKEQLETNDWFNASGILRFSVGDDDGINYVDVLLLDENGNKFKDAQNKDIGPTEITTFSKGTKSAPIAYTLPEKEGVYQLKVFAKDSTWTEATKANRQVEYGPFILGIDKTSPSVTDSSSEGEHYSKAGISLSGTASDTNGVKEIKVEVFELVKDEQTGIESPKATATKTYDNLTGTTKVAYPSEANTNKWTLSIPDADIPEGKYQIKTTVTDVAGKTESVNSIWYKDKTISAPTLNIQNTISYDGKDWVNVKNVTLSVTASDALSGINAVYCYTDSDSTERKMSLSGSSYVASIPCTDGKVIFYVKAMDNAGNKNATAVSKTIYVDSTAPAAPQLYSIRGNTSISSNTVLVSSTGSLDFVITANDANADETTKSTGIKTAKITKIGENELTTPIEATLDSGNYKFTIGNSVIKTGTGASATYKTGKVYVVLTDNLDNESTEFDVISIDIDSVPPTIAADIMLDADSSTTVFDVNGDVTFSGTASDLRGLDKVVVYYAIVESDFPAIPAEADRADSSKWTGWTKEDATGSNVWSLTLPAATTLANDGKKLKFVAVALDKAGNTAIAESANLFINKDSDRPKIILSDITLTAGANDKFWHMDSTLSGSVSDDDGIVTSVQYSLNGTDYSDIYEPSKNLWKIENLPDQENTIYFKIEDKAGKIFTSAATGMTGPKIIDKTGTAKLGITGSVSEILTLSVDTIPPAPETFYGFVTATIDNEPTDWSDYDWTEELQLSKLSTIGGENKKYLYFKTSATDGNGISDITVTLGGENGLNAATNNNDAKVLYTSSSDNKAEIVVRFDLSKLGPSEQQVATVELKMVATDASGATNDSEQNLRVDNNKPVINLPAAIQNATVFGGVPNTISGTTTDGSNITLLQYAVTTTTTNPADNAWKDVKYAIAEDDQISRTNWSIMFDGGPTTKEAYHTNVLNDLSGKTPEQIQASDDEYSLYVWFRATDEFGNVSDVKKCNLTVIPNGDKPRVEVTAPKADKKAGGEIRVQGNAVVQSTDVIVDKVYIQIDPSGSNFGAGSNWKTALETLTSGKSTGYDIVATGLTGEKAYGILATGTNSWNISINRAGEFDAAAEESNKKIAIRAFAVNKSATNNESYTPKVSEFFTVNNVEVDPNSPQYSTLELVKRDSDGTELARKNYYDGISISNVGGKWYLESTITSSADLASVAVNGVNEPGITSGLKEYKLSYLISSETDSTAYKHDIELNVRVTDASGLSNEIEKLTIKLDNKAPEFDVYDLKGGTNNYTENKIGNSNGTFEISGNVVEAGSEVANQSGFNRVVMYYTTTVDGKTYITDPMQDPGTTGKANRSVDVTDYTPVDGIYWSQNTKATVTADVITAKAAIPSYVRPGSILKFRGVIYTVSAVNSTEKTITLRDVSVVDTPNADKAAGEDIYYAINALVIDNEVQEFGDTTTYDPDKTGLTNDDGDQMIEKAVIQGATCEWSGKIDTTNILDGNVKIHLVAFDKADNSVSKEFCGNISNNSPRIAGLIYGADNNGNDQVEADEMFNTYANIYATSLGISGTGLGATKVTEFNNFEAAVTARTDTALVVKGAMKVIPRIVGGNLGLNYKMTYQTAASGNAEKSTTGRITTNHAKSDSIRSDNDTTIAFTTLQLLKLDDNNGIKTGTQTLKFEITDNTETGANTVTFNLPVNIIFADTTPPTAVWTPLYWNDNTSNSLYKNSTSYGHIELGDDWEKGTGYTSAAQKTGLYDKDPKVSGIITLEGTAEDNVIVNSLVMKVNNGTDITIASRSNGAWTSTHEYNATTSDFSDSSWYFELLTDTFDKATGKNTVTFKVHWNTGDATTKGILKVSGTVKAAALDVPVTITANDRGSVQLNTGKTDKEYVNSKSSTPGATATGSTKTGYFKFDVVPYISRIYTELAGSVKNVADKWSSVNRTQQGAYPVRVTTKTNTGAAGTAETVAIYGFNLTGAEDTNTKAGNNVTLSNFAADDNYPIISNSKYDNLKFTVDNFKTATTGNINNRKHSLPSGNFELKVNSVPSINNLNYNDAQGVTGGIAVAETDYETKAYNRQPNRYNNKQLTDDVTFDVWELNSQAVQSDGGTIDQPIMRINPSSNKVGFAFSNGSFYYSMPGKINGTEKSYNLWVKSHDYVTSVGFTYDASGNAWGVAAGGDVGNDGSDYDDQFSLYSDVFGQGTIDQTYGTHNGANLIRMESIGWKNYSYTQEFNKQRIISPSIVTSGNNVYLAYYDDMLGEIRYRYGDTTKKGNTTTYTENITETIHLVYGIDQVNGGNNGNLKYAHIRRRTGLEEGTKVQIVDSKGNPFKDRNGKVWTGEYTIKNLNGNNGNYYFTLEELPGQGNDDTFPFGSYRVEGQYWYPAYGATDQVYIKAKTNKNVSNISFGNFQDTEVYNRDILPYPFLNANIIAGPETTVTTGSESTSGKRKPGEFVNIGVVKNSSSADQLAAIWYDGDTLWYSLNTTPTTLRSGVKTAAEWSEPVRVFPNTDRMKNAGQYCKLVVDVYGGVHIAAYNDRKDNVCYAYLPSNKYGSVTAQTDFATCVVDSYGAVGENLSLDVAITDSTNKKVTPYISYFNGSTNTPKVAFVKNGFVDGTTTLSDNADIRNYFASSGIWEISNIPTKSELQMRTTQHKDIGVGVWKTNTGVLKNSVTGTNTTSTTNNNGDVYGNGTNNPMLGYVIVKTNTAANIETAQKR